MKEPALLLCCAILCLSSLSHAGHYLGGDGVNTQDKSESQDKREHQDPVQFLGEKNDVKPTDSQRSKRKTAKDAETLGKTEAASASVTESSKSSKTKAPAAKSKGDSSSKKKAQLQQSTTTKPDEEGSKTLTPAESTTTQGPSTSTSKSKQGVSPSTTTTTTPKPVQDEDIYCMCDILKNACDMNCCCDRECTKEDQHFFTHCIDQVGEIHDVSLARRQRSCYRSFVAFKHNHLYGDKVQNENGMLCIVRDNNKFDNILPAVKIEELKERVRKNDVDIRPKYVMNPDLQQMIRWEPYKYGSPILAAKDLDFEKNKAEIIYYGIPTAYQALLCTKLKEPIRFLENSAKECRFLLSNLSQDCMNLEILNAAKLTDLLVVKNPANEEPPFLPISITRICLSGVCSNQLNASAADVSTPTWNKKNSKCQNVLNGLNLTFTFGPSGITEVFAEVELEDLSPSSSPKSGPVEVAQRYRVTFVLDDWTNKTKYNGTAHGNYTEAIPKSGNPGYIVGKPVIMGEKIIVHEEIEKELETGATETPEEESQVEVTEKEVVLVWKDASRWMSVHGPGVCSKNPSASPSRKSALFDYSHITMCSLNLTKFKQCDDLQRYIAKVLLGVDDPDEFSKKSWQVAAFGNADPRTPSEWVPVTFKNFPIQTQGNAKGLVEKGCDSIISSLKITVVYSFVGSVDYPQAKIVGVLYEPGDSITVRSKLLRSLSVTTSLNFQDITEPPLMRVPLWPVLSITLPKDFFYPFTH